MARLRIAGGTPLSGRIAVSGAKNAALPLMAASLLTDRPLTLTNLPDLADIDTLGRVLAHHGATVERPEPGRARLTAAALASSRAPYELVRRMRASVLVLGPLLARNGHAEVSLPGGCAIGTRPIDLHLRGLEALGAEIELTGGYVVARAPRGLHGGEVAFPHASVGATENVLMAAALADGETVITGAACEPEVADLATCLTRMGAAVTGAGTDTVHVRGAPRLDGAEHPVLPDRIETGTYAVAAAITGGKIALDAAGWELLPAAAERLAHAGVDARPGPGGAVTVRAGGEPPAATDVTTAPHPGFPTDLQAQIMALMTLARGESVITETIFENRFMHVPELTRMGADIRVEGGTAVVRGQSFLDGAPVMASDLRASAGLVLAGLAARGETVVNRVYHLERGYENLVGKLAACGARIARETDDGGEPA